MFGIMSVAQEIPRSLAANRPCIPECGAAQTSYLELGEGGTQYGSGFSLHCGVCRRPISPGDRWSISGVVSGKHRPGTSLPTSFLLCTVQVVSQPPVWCTSVCLQAPPKWEGGKKKKWEVSSAQKQINVSQVDCLQGQLTCCGLQLNPAI